MSKSDPVGFRAWRLRLASPLLLALSGCQAIVLHPAGDIARQQAHLVVLSTLLMLVIVLPVMAMTVLFAWHYRQSNRDAQYAPDWNHSVQLELAIWSAPLLIIICLGALTWVSTHLLDPYRPISQSPYSRISAREASSAPLEIDVVALDWKWLFIYPEQQIATVNDLVVPTGRPLRFRITSASVMNSFFVPALAGQIYAMPGMETTLQAVMDRPGSFKGFSANYSGAGFSGMHFGLRGLAPDQFAAWAASARSGSEKLDREAYLALSRPSQNVPAHDYAGVSGDLFDAVVNMCVRPGKLCASRMMAIDDRGGTGPDRSDDAAMLAYDRSGSDGAGGAATLGAAMSDCRAVGPGAAAMRLKLLCADNTPGRAASVMGNAPAALTLSGSGLGGGGLAGGGLAGGGLAGAGLRPPVIGMSSPSAPNGSGQALSHAP